jgi:hypothetical protein
MNSSPIIVVVFVIAVIAILAIAFGIRRKRRRQKLRECFGSEYDRVVRSEGDVRKGKGVLEFREKRRQKLEIRALSPADRTNFLNRWNDVQSRFVDDPKSAVTQADGLVMEVMQARDYPMGDFEQRAADVSVDHPLVVENYRAAHPITLRHSRGQASTDDLCQAWCTIERCSSNRWINTNQKEGGHNGHATEKR